MILAGGPELMTPAWHPELMTLAASGFWLCLAIPAYDPELRRRPWLATQACDLAGGFELMTLAGKPSYLAGNPRNIMP